MKRWSIVAAFVFANVAATQVPEAEWLGMQFYICPQGMEKPLPQDCLVPYNIEADLEAQRVYRHGMRFRGAHWLGAELRYKTGPQEQCEFVSNDTCIKQAVFGPYEPRLDYENVMILLGAPDWDYTIKYTLRGADQRILADTTFSFHTIPLHTLRIKKTDNGKPLEE